MEAFRGLFLRPDPVAQNRKCNALIRTNIRKLDRDISNAKRTELQAKNFIIQADRRGQRDPSKRKQAQKEIRQFAVEVIAARKQEQRLVTSKAQLNSVQMQVNEAFAVRKIEGTLKVSVNVMKEVNSLVKLPELAHTMQELNKELMSAGIIDEMVGESLPEDDIFEDEEAEGEVDKVLGEILKDKMEATGKLPTAAPAKAEPEKKVAEDEEEEEDTEAMMDQMRNRLEALRS